MRAEEDILQPKPGQPGAFVILYHKGDFVREEDLAALGLSQSQRKAATPPPQDKAKRGPREGRKRSAASRDKAMNGPKDEEEATDG